VFLHNDGAGTNELRVAMDSSSAQSHWCNASLPAWMANSFEVRIRLEGNDLTVRLHGLLACTTSVFTSKLSGASNVKLYAGDPWYSPASATNVTNIRYQCLPVGTTGLSGVGAGLGGNRDLFTLGEWSYVYITITSAGYVTVYRDGKTIKQKRCLLPVFLVSDFFIIPHLNSARFRYYSGGIQHWICSRLDRTLQPLHRAAFDAVLVLERRDLRPAVLRNARQPGVW
jgi:hypothetical protein